MGSSTDGARNTYVQEHAVAVVTNVHLRIAIVALSLTLTGMVTLMFWVYSWAKHQKPLVVRIDDVGRATALNYSEFGYKPEDKELRYFLGQFVQLHYGREVATVREHYGLSLYFLDRKLSQALVEEERRNQNITKFTRDASDECDVQVRNVSLQDIHASPMKATVDFEKVFYSRGDHQEIRRERYAGYFEFIVSEDVPNSFVLVNPLGLVITYYRADAAFE